jgi:hypothetical protein
MRLIKLALISMVVFFSLITAMSLLIPSHVRISRAINISRSTDSSLYLIKSLDQWPRWHPAFQLQNATAIMKKHHISIIPVQQTDTLITMHWKQAGKPPVLNSWQVHRFATSDSATLQWYMDFQLPWYPWQKFSSLFYERTYGTMIEQGLRNIKRIGEERK